MREKVFPSCEAAVADIPDGATIMVGGFGPTGGRPDNLIQALIGKGVENITAIANGIGGLLPLAEARVLKKLVASFPASARGVTVFEKQYLAGEVELEVLPQGTLAERIRAGGAGLGGFYTPTGVGTVAEVGKEKRVIEGTEYILEFPLRADFALVKAFRADKIGNLVYRGTSRNFNPQMAAAAEVTIVEVEGIVEVGELDPELIATPGIYVDRIVVVPRGAGARPQAPTTVRPEGRREYPEAGGKPGLTHELMALRVVKEFRAGDVVNLGVGIPTLISSFAHEGAHFLLQSQNGVLGYAGFAPEGQEDPDYINAGGQFVTLLPGTSFFSSADSFAMIRGGHVDVTVLGGLQVSERGDLANWMVPERGMGSIGGAMDLATGSKRVIVVMEHTTTGGRPKIVKECSYPLTARGVVDLIITDLAVIEVTPSGLLLKEVASSFTAREVQSLTEVELRVSPDLREMEF